MVLGEGCFQASGLTSIRVPESVRETREEAFADCAALREVEFAAHGLDEIGERAFANTALQRVRVPSSARVARNAFERSRARRVSACAAQ